MQLSEAKHAFITGGASGIGLGIADALAARGIAVTIADINDEALSAVLATRANRMRGIVLDTRERERWAEARVEAEAAFGPVDILVNNAGISPNGVPLADMDPESYDRVLAINLGGIINGVFAFAAAMRDLQRGHIVNTSSQAGLMTTAPGVGAYSIAKFGVTALSEQLRTELEPFSVGVTLLCPSYVPTNLAANTRRLGGEVRQYSSHVPPVEVTAAEVGEMVAAGIEENAPYVMTGRNVWPGIEPRMNAIRHACEKRDAA